MSKLRVFFSFMLLASFSPFLSAQPDGDNLSRHFLVDVKNGMGPQFETAFKAHLQWRKEQGDPWNWMVYQLVNGEHMGDYVVRSGPHAWADFDKYEEFMTKGSPHFWNAVGAYVESAPGYITRFDASISRWPEDQSGIKYLTVVEYWVKPTHAQAFVQTVREIHEAIGKSGWPVKYGWENTVNGGPAGLWTLVLPNSSYADMKGPDKPLPAMLTEVYGPEKTQKMLGAFAESTARSESHVALFRPDLSLIR